MASRIGKHIEGLALVLRAVVQHPSTQLLGTLAMPLQVLESVSARRAMTASPGGRSPSSYSFRLMPASRARAVLVSPRRSRAWRRRDGLKLMNVRGCYRRCTATSNTGPSPCPAPRIGSGSRFTDGRRMRDVQLST